MSNTVQRRQSSSRTVSLRQIGSIDLMDLDIISKSYGREFLPYPFMSTQPSRFSTRDEYLAYAATVPDRFNHGDLRTFRRWAASYAYAEIRVEGHVQYIPADTPSIRVVANRLGELGYLAKQRPNEDVIDVYEVSPYELGDAVADSVDLVRPGQRSLIVIPEYLPSTAENNDTAEEFTVREVIGAAVDTEVRRADVTAYGTVQSHWRPTRRWGFDRGRKAATWVRIRDDGDYLYSPDFSQARPMRQLMLADRIDTLIAEDVKALRDFRDG